MKKILSVILVITMLASCSDKGTVKFAVITDIHQDIMHDSPERLREFLKAAGENQVDFVIDLGDFCFPTEENLPFIRIWRDYRGEKHNVIGNHDTDRGTKEDFMEYTGMPSRYYSFDKGDFHFIVLDPNNRFVDGTYISAERGGWNNPDSDYIDEEQIIWLEEDLRRTKKRTIVFSHQSLDRHVRNGDRIREIFEKNNAGRSGKVVAVFSGHDHIDGVNVINGISYILINSASNKWVGGKYSVPHRFSDEINKRRPSLKYTVPYGEPLYAIVTLDSKKMEIKGRQTSIIPPLPEGLNVPADVMPFISDYTLNFD